MIGMTIVAMVIFSNFVLTLLFTKRQHLSTTRVKPEACMIHEYGKGEGLFAIFNKV